MNQDFCVVLGCKNSATSPHQQKSQCQFFKFPLEQKDLTETWLQRLNLVGWTPGPESLVCEEHFSTDSFEMTDDRKHLRPKAIPAFVDGLETIILRYTVHNKNDCRECPPETGQIDEFRCRICAASICLEDAIDVYSHDENVIPKILKCIPFLEPMRTRDYLPKYICIRCLADLNTSYRMLIRAIEAEKFFARLLLNDDNCNDDAITVEKTDLNAPSNELNSLEDDIVNERNAPILKKLDQVSSFTDTCDLHKIDFLPDHPLEDGSGSEAVIVEVCNTDFNFEGETDFPDNRTSGDRDSSSFNSGAIRICHKEDEHLLPSLEENTSKCEKDIIENEMSLSFECQYCSATYDTKEVLEKHLDSHVISDWCEDSKVECKPDDDSDILVHFCKICFVVFSTHDSLMQHSKSVHDLKFVGNVVVQDYKCEECGKQFKTKLNLTIHERLHTGARPYICENCGRSFRSPSTLLQHLRTHQGEKKFVCAVCDKAFGRKEFLVAHSRIHTGERPFKCKICKNSYTQVGDLRRHQQKHHSSKLSSCGTSSGRGFAAKESFKRTKKS